MSVVDAHKLACIRALAADGLTSAEIAGRLSVHRDTVSRAAREAGITLHHAASHGAAIKIARLQELAAQGLSAQEIADALGLPCNAVRGLATRARIAIRTLSREERAGSQGGRKKIRVPSWVAPSLRGEYRDQARDHGEDWAARAVRRLMADMRAAEAAR